MARGTGKDHARWPLSLWGRDELLDLTPPAQHLLMVLWTHTDLSYCGAGEWHPGRIATRANGWTGANEKTVKNWFAGRYGPSGEHLAVLVRHSDEVLNAFLVMAGRDSMNSQSGSSVKASMISSGESFTSSMILSYKH